MQIVSIFLLKTAIYLNDFQPYVNRVEVILKSSLTRSTKTRFQAHETSYLLVWFTPEISGQNDKTYV